MRHASTLQPYDQQIKRLNHALVFLLKSYQEANKLGVQYLFQILTQKKYLNIFWIEKITMITVQNTYSCPLPKTKLSCAIVFDLRNIGITISVASYFSQLGSERVVHAQSSLKKAWFCVLLIYYYIKNAIRLSKLHT